MSDEPIAVNLAAPASDLWPADPRDRTKAAARAMSRLWRAGIVTVGDLTGKTAADIRDIRGAGDTTVDEVRRALAACGLSLRDDDENAAAREFARIRLLRGAGLGPVAARRFARELWPAGEIAPGVTVSVASEANHG